MQRLRHPQHPAPTPPTHPPTHPTTHLHPTHAHTQHPRPPPSQWEVQAGLTSDFGFGDRKRQRLEFVDTFQDSYSLRQLRISGDEVRVLYAHPGQWRVYVVPRGGDAPKLIASLDKRPSYKELEETLKSAYPESNANKGWLERLKDEARWVQDSLKQPPQ